MRKKCPLVQVCIPECVCVSFLILADASSIEPFFKIYNSQPDFLEPVGSVPYFALSPRRHCSDKEGGGSADIGGYAGGGADDMDSVDDEDATGEFSALGGNEMDVVR